MIFFKIFSFLLELTAIASTSVGFLVIGDMGTGTPEQFEVAKAMKEVCAQRGCAFVISTGDNIYEYGVSSVQDPQFQSKFEKPYAELDIPFFLVLGNHDQEI